MTVTEQLVGKLRNDIVSGHLHPGERLRIDQLKERYDGPSATPLREALTRLAGEWIVEQSRGSGFRVAALSRADLYDVTRVRVLLECEALRDSLARGDNAWEASVLAAHHRVSRLPVPLDLASYPEWESLNECFHDALIAACESAWLLRLRKATYYAHKRYRILSVRHAGDPGATQPTTGAERRDEHRIILEAALDRDADAACAATARHIELTRDLIVARRWLEDGVSAAG